MSGKGHMSAYTIPLEETNKQKSKGKTQVMRWQKKILKSMWGSLLQLWTTQHKERHGWDKEGRDNARREVMHTELFQIYYRKHEYPPQQVQHLLRTTYEIHIQETVTKITDWLDAYKGTFAVTWSPD
jgi:hypothetical protein